MRIRGEAKWKVLARVESKAKSQDIKKYKWYGIKMSKQSEWKW